MIGAVISAIGGIASQWLRNRGDVSKAKHERKVARIKQDADWEATMAQGSMTSWKDEYWTVLLSVPVIMLFIPVPEVQEIAKAGFAELDNTPEWYRWALGVAIAAAFGVRKVANMIGGKK